MKRTVAIPEPPHPLAAAGLALAACSALFFYPGFAAQFIFSKFLVLCAGVWLASLGAVLSKNLAVGRGELDAPLFLFAAAVALSTFQSQDRLVSVLGESYAYGLWPLCLIATVAWLAARLAAGRQTPLLRACLAAYALIGLYAALQAVGLEPFSGMPLPPDHRSYATLGTPVFLGECMVLMLPVGIFWALEGRERLLGWCCLAAILAGLLTSISRGAWLGALVGAGAYLAAGRKTEFLENHRRALLALAAAAIACGVCVWRLGPRSKAASDSGRVQIWREAWDVSRERPLLGWGPDTFRITAKRHRTPEMARLNLFETPAHAHNDLLQALATTGVVGFAAYVVLLFFAGRAALRSWRSPERTWGQAVACGLLGLFIVMKFNPMPVEVLACAAFFAGLLAPATSAAQGPAARPARWPFSLLLAAATVSAGAAVQLARAELAEKAGIRAIIARRYEVAQRHCEEAVRLNPWNVDYRYILVNLLFGRSVGAAAPAVRIELLETAEKVAQEAAAIHPNDPSPLWLSGAAELNLAWSGVPGKLAAAVRSFDSALVIDPTYVQGLQGRRNAARTAGDSAKAAEMSERIAALTGSGTAPTLGRAPEPWRAPLK